MICELLKTQFHVPVHRDATYCFVRCTNAFQLRYDSNILYKDTSDFVIGSNEIANYLQKDLIK